MLVELFAFPVNLLAETTMCLTLKKELNISRTFVRLCMLVLHFKRKETDKIGPCEKT